MSVFLFIFFMFGFLPEYTEPPVPQDIALPARSEVIAGINLIMEQAVISNAVTGAIVIVGHGDDILIEKAYGRKSPSPESPAMTEDTLFDIASLTKVIATAPAVMMLTERGKLHLDDTLKKCLPAAGTKNRSSITVRQLLTHYSGLTGTIHPSRRKKKRIKPPSGNALLSKIYAAPLEAKPGSAFVYSDLGYIMLGKIVERASGQSLDRFASENIFSPLAMNDTSYRPDKKKFCRTAFSEEERAGRYLCGYVQDPIARKLNGVTGHAGLFSTARDLSRFARMMLNGGELEGKRILKSETIAMMTAPQSPAGKDDVRGLGWDIESRYSSLKGAYFPQQSYGHTGYTGTSLWIDPQTKTYVILLTCRSNLEDNTAIKALRTELSNYAGSLYYPSPMKVKGF